METMTDWQEPLIEGEQYAVNVGSGVLKRAGARISDRVREGLEKGLEILRNAPDRPDLVSKHTEGLVHASPVPGSKDVFATIPHGEVDYRKVSKIPEMGVVAGDVYRSPGLARDFPEVLETIILPDKKYDVGLAGHTSGPMPGNMGPSHIVTNPYTLKSPSYGKPFLGHELTHAAAGLSDPSTVLRGGNPRSFVRIAEESAIPEQWLLAKRLAAGGKLPEGTAETIPLVLRKAASNPASAAQMDDMVMSVSLLRNKDFARDTYKSLFGEASARYYQNFPNEELSQVPLWLRENWDAPRRMYGTAERRLSGSLAHDPRKSSMSLPTDFPQLIRMLDR